MFSGRLKLTLLHTDFITHKQNKTIILKRRPQTMSQKKKNKHSIDCFTWSVTDLVDELFASVKDIKHAIKNTHSKFKIKGVNYN